LVDLTFDEAIWCTLELHLREYLITKRVMSLDASLVRVYPTISFQLCSRHLSLSDEDVGWITGHSYIVYGPLLNGATTVIFEGLPTIPNASRYWDLVQKHKLTQLYTAPTAIRTLMTFGTDPFKGYDLSSLRLLGSVGEPINPEVWNWYRDNAGSGSAAVVDTYWQTETGGIIIAPLPGATPMKPGSATLPFFGIKLALLEPETGKEIDISKGAANGVLAISAPWPGMARTIYKDHTRYLEAYYSMYKGFYFTGDGVRRDEDGYCAPLSYTVVQSIVQSTDILICSLDWITGRVDDVINKAGHRLGTAEIESALVAHEACSEAAVVAAPGGVKGEIIVAFCSLRDHYRGDDDVILGLKETVKKMIGKLAVPDVIILTQALPKTRSGKIMRRRA
jgi:acetyl-CoA synthetase